MEAKTKTETKTGIITRLVYTKKYGFITPDDESPDIFFHQSGLISPNNFNDLREGYPVTYIHVENDDRNGTRAIGVVVD